MRWKRMLKLGGGWGGSAHEQTTSAVRRWRRAVRGSNVSCAAIRSARLARAMAAPPCWSISEHLAALSSSATCSMGCWPCTTKTTRSKLTPSSSSSSSPPQPPPCLSAPASSSPDENSQLDDGNQLGGGLGAACGADTSGTGSADAAAAEPSEIVSACRSSACNRDAVSLPPDFAIVSSAS